MRGTANLFVDWMSDYRAHLNQLPSDDQARCQRAGGDSNIYYLQSRWRLAPDEALLIEPTRIPRLRRLELPAQQLLDGVARLSHAPHPREPATTAKREPDGSLRIVRRASRSRARASRTGSTTAGHARGGMLFRWIGADGVPAGRTRVVDFADLG